MAIRKICAAIICCALAGCTQLDDADMRIVSACESRAHSTAVCECATRWIKRNTARDQYSKYVALVGENQRIAQEAMESGKYADVTDPWEQMRIMYSILDESADTLGIGRGEAREITDTVGSRFDKQAVPDCQS